MSQLFDDFQSGGEGGIRTHVPKNREPLFESGTIGLSVTSPNTKRWAWFKPIEFDKYEYYESVLHRILNIEMLCSLYVPFKISSKH